MHKYEVFEVDSTDGSTKVPTGKFVELDSSWGTETITNAVLKQYGFTQYASYYNRYGSAGDSIIKLNYGGQGTHWILKKV